MQICSNHDCLSKSAQSNISVKYLWSIYQCKLLTLHIYFLQCTHRNVLWLPHTVGWPLGFINYYLLTTDVTLKKSDEVWFVGTFVSRMWAWRILRCSRMSFTSAPLVVGVRILKLEDKCHCVSDTNKKCKAVFCLYFSFSFIHSANDFCPPLSPKATHKAPSCAHTR